MHVKTGKDEDATLKDIIENGVAGHYYIPFSGKAPWTIGTTTLPQGESYYRVYKKVSAAVTGVGTAELKASTDWSLRIWNPNHATTGYATNLSGGSSFSAAYGKSPVVGDIAMYNTSTSMYLPYIDQSIIVFKVQGEKNSVYVIIGGKRCTTKYVSY
jgi:hypothetical protein